MLGGVIRDGAHCSLTGRPNPRRRGGLLAPDAMTQKFAHRLNNELGKAYGPTRLFLGPNGGKSRRLLEQDPQEFRERRDPSRHHPL